MRLLKLGCFGAVFSCFAFGTGLPLAAESVSEWVVTDQSRLRLISSHDGVGTGDSLRIGLQIQLNPGWKTYWRYPGDAGIPPRLDWSGSENLKSADIRWPLPEQFEAYGFSSWGYRREVVFPIDIKLQETGKRLDLKLHLLLGICEDVCIPYEHHLALALDAGRGDLTKEAAIIEEFASRVPEQIGSDGTPLTQATAKAGEDGRFMVTVEATQTMEEPSIIVEGKEGAYFDLVSTKLTNEREQAVFEINGHLPAKTDRISGQSITVTIFDKAISGEKELRIQ
jgi:suppressor for copper-sensitivity B